MSDSIRIIGIHPVAAGEPCHLVEIELPRSCEAFDFELVTQEQPGQPRQNWQAAYDEQYLGQSASGQRWSFFFHYMDFERPLLTPRGPLTLQASSPLRSHLARIRYEAP